MSNIVEKPFSWANKIIRAVFRGAPNLITSTDLNRQIEALKKEMYVLQQNLPVVSDLTYTYDHAEKRITAEISYVFCRGVRFNVSGGTFNVADVGGYDETKTFNFALRLYAKEKLVTDSDDPSKSISGAKFSDGTSQPAADHYVYEDPFIALVVNSISDKDKLEYGDYEGGLEEGQSKHICTLLTLHFPEKAGHYATNWYIKNYACHALAQQQNGTGNWDKMAQFNEVGYVNSPEQYKTELVPSADDGWREVAQKLWKRLYSLEKKMFFDTTYNNGTNGTIDVNGTSYQFKTAFTAASGSDAQISGEFYIAGALCCLSAEITVLKETGSGTFSFPKSTLGYPSPKKSTGSYSFTSYNADPVKYALAEITIDDMEILVTLPMQIESDSKTFGYHIVYPIDTKDTWSYSADDTHGQYNYLG